VKMFYHLLKISTTFFSRWSKISPALAFHLPKFLTTIFSQFLAFYISTIENAAGTTAQAISSDLTQHFLYIFRFPPLFSTLALPNLQLQLHNCHFTTANYILQLQKLSSVAR